MERGERIFVLCFALKFPADMLWLLWLVFALSMVTAAQRFVRVWRLADKPPKPEPAAVIVRWRAWREGRAGEASWWAPAARAGRGTGPSSEGGLSGRPFSSSGTDRGFFSGSRRPSGAAARRHERRLERRQRMKDEQAGLEPHDASEEHPEDRERSTRWRPPSTGQG
jgi:hypothetical protein